MKKRRDIAGICRATYVIIVCVILLAPLMLIIPMSFNDGTYLSFPPTKLSLRWYESVLSSPSWIRAGSLSVLIGAATMLCATLLGTLGAYFIVRSRSRLATPVQLLLLSPMMVPTMVIAIAIYRLWAQWGLTNSIGGLVIAHTVLAAPLVVVAVTASLRTVNETLERAAASLGAGPWSVFWRITFPIILPGILTGALFAFVTSFDEIVITMFLAGPDTMTLTKRLWDGIRYEVDPSSAVVASIMIFIELFVFCLMIVARGARRTAAI
jgi:putative spermidine/putrescine transport system permease protein